MNIKVNFNVELTDFEQNAIIEYGKTVGFDFDKMEGKRKNFIKLVLKHYGTNIILTATEWCSNELVELGYSNSEINKWKEKK